MSIPISNVNMNNKASTPLLKFKGVSSIPTDANNNFSWNNLDDVNKYKVINSEFRISTPIRQGNCGDCWAISTAQVFADRWAIEAKQTVPTFSHTLLLSCSILPATCGGGSIEEAINYIATNGIVKSEECWNYDWCKNVENCSNVNIPNINRAQITASIPSCTLQDKCIAFNSNGQLYTKDQNLLSKRYKCKDWNELNFTTYYKSCKTFKILNNEPRENVINKIKEEIFLRGPVVSSFRLIPDHFKNNANWINKIYVYRDQEDYCTRDFETNTNTGGHAVAIVGWGKDESSNIEYWIVRNTWGIINDLNHDNGYFKMAISNCNQKINITMGLDIPFNVIERYGPEERDVRYNTFGGVYAMLPSVDTNDYNKTVSGSTSITESTASNTKNKNKWWLIILVGTIILLFIIIYIIISKSKKIDN